MLLSSQLPVTIDGPHRLHSLRLIKGARLAHSTGNTSGMNLEVTEDCLISDGSAISVDGLGYRINKWPRRWDG